MARDKPKKSALADDMEAREPLDGERDLFAEIGLGLGASLRAKELVLKGLFAEIYEQHLVDLAEMKRGRGRPKKETSIDIERAAAVLAADDFVRAKTGKGCLTQRDATQVAKEIEKILVESGCLRSGAFTNPPADGPLATSVSRGIGILEERGRFSKKKLGFIRE
jgi:hypothetical protein